MGVKVTNNAYGTLASGISSGATTIVLASGQGARFPSLSGSDWFWGTLVDGSNNIEVVKVTARSTDTLTVTRAQDDTTAKAYLTGDRFELRTPAALFNDKLDTATAATTYQPLDADLTAIAALSSAANKVPYATGSNTWALTDLTAAGRALIDDADAAAQLVTLGAVAKAGETMSGLLKLAKGADIASASTVNLSTATGNTVHITGTTGITAWTMTSGQVMDVIFDGALTLTHHATNNNLPGAANITTAAGDRARLFYDGTTVYVLAYIRANGGIIRGLGVGQTFTDVAASRAAGVTYTNSTDYPIWVTISAYTNVNAAVYLNLNGSNQQVRNDGIQAGVPDIFQAIVKPGDTYLLTSSAGTLTIAKWWELR